MTLLYRMSKKWFILFFILLVFVIGGYLHTNTLEVTHHQISIGPRNKKLKIAHVTDLHTDGLARIERELINVLKIEKPDLIVITGDLTTPSGTINGYREVLSHLKAPKGDFFVSGNWEYWEPIHDLKNLFIETKITDLTNQAKKIDSGLWLVGFDDSEEGSPHVEILKNIPSHDLKLALFHSPAFFDSIVNKIQLSFAGHSHGGQIRIPLVGSLWLPNGTGKYDQGWFEKGTSKMYVSRGIGTSILPIRVNCSPELAIIEISY